MASSNVKPRSNLFRREDPRDAVIMKEGLGSSLSDLPPSSVIGTSSVRRRAQLVGKFPHLTFADVRGNLNTRCQFHYLLFATSVCES